MYRLCRLAIRCTAKLQIPYECSMHNNVRKEVLDTLGSIRECKQYAAFLKDNLPVVSDKELAFVFQQVRYHQIPLDNSFKEVLLPIACQYIKVYGRQNMNSLTRIACALAQLGVNDPTIWTAIEDKLVKERLYRYITIAGSVDLAEHLIANKIGSNALLSCLNDTIMNHGLYLRELPKYSSKVKAMLPQLERIERERLQQKPQQKQLT